MYVSAWYRYHQGMKFERYRNLKKTSFQLVSIAESETPFCLQNCFAQMLF